MANPFMIGNTVNTEQYNTQKEFKEYALKLIWLKYITMCLIEENICFTIEYSRYRTLHINLL